ncbi:malonyl CoA-acyl carrier protein transacylase [Paenibacillus curdlanolyticus YK9]|uniref:[acyl-carrier-protein] S-malonyltransferase n=1 Tax=Paenibacillus curdlanolyticus YK9 TaxID=717606 RepID=E0I747_9BACL|nr:ACP S-malonyltransferase [Paenibacillus curdlanolyticus]EFM11863.1 malonyl CoA-acyl carrier protein transacylase [Paenibacillus curdlanolyticus YK9]
MNIALLFPGQGSQYIGMGNELCNQFEVAGRTFEEAGDLLNIDVSALCNNSPEQFNRTDMLQPILLTLSVAAYRVLEQETTLAISFGAGHSLGEYSALVCSGAISFADGLQIVQKRGRFMESLAPAGGGMLAVLGSTIEDIQEVCSQIERSGKRVVLANCNSDSEVILSGDVAAIQAAGRELEKRGAIIKTLPVSGAFHSPYMELASEKMKVELQHLKVSYESRKWDVFSNVTALPYESEEQVRNLLAEQMVSQVRWNDTMNELVQRGADSFIEVGPKAVLTKLMKQKFPTTRCFPMEGQQQLQLIKSELGAKETTREPSTAVGQWGEEFIGRCLAIAAATRNRNPNNAEYESAVVASNEKLRLLKQTVESEKIATIGQIQKSMELLKTILMFKKALDEEVRERIRMLEENPKFKHFFQ